MPVLGCDRRARPELLFLAAMNGYERFVEQLDYPMYIVTAFTDGDRAGCLVGFVTQCSIDPAHWLVCISKNNRTFRVARRAELLGVHVVPEEALDLAELFGGETGDEIDKFERCAWAARRQGVPILDRCSNWFVGNVVDLRDGGDHGIFEVDVVEYGPGSHERPLMFKQAKHIEPGHPA